MKETIYLQETFDCLDDVDGMFGHKRPPVVGVWFDKEYPVYRIYGVDYPMGTRLTLNDDRTVSFLTPDGNQGVIHESI